MIDTHIAVTVIAFATGLAIDTDRTGSSAAIDVGLIAVGHQVVAARCGAAPLSVADPLGAVGGLKAVLPRPAGAAGRAAAVGVGLVTVAHAVGALRIGAHTVAADLVRAISVVGAALAIDAHHAGPAPAVDIALPAIENGVVARRRSAPALIVADPLLAIFGPRAAIAHVAGRAP